MTRRIVQIELSPPTDGSAEGLYALCEDSSIHYGWWTTGVFEWRDTLPPVDPDSPQDEPAVDPIAEIEAMGGRIIIVHDPVVYAHQLWWFVDTATQELICAQNAPVSSIRNAARRLLERIRGAK